MSDQGPVPGSSNIPGAHVVSAAGAEEGGGFLVEFAELWGRGRADRQKLWDLFDVCDMYMFKPDYYGAPIFTIGGTLLTPVFSRLDLLTEFLAATIFDPEHHEDGFDWVQVTGQRFLRLPIRARFLVIDPGQEHSTVVDFATRDTPVEMTAGAPPFAANLESGDAGAVIANFDRPVPGFTNPET